MPSLLCNVFFFTSVLSLSISEGTYYKLLLTSSCVALCFQLTSKAVAWIRKEAKPRQLVFIGISLNFVHLLDSSETFIQNKSPNAQALLSFSIIPMYP
jgi:ABC-type Fe3+-siderophore transport system permease subunit